MQNDSQEERVLKRYERLVKVIESLSDEKRKDAILTMCKEIGVRFCTAPASNRTTYHDCYMGGLFDHSIKVVKNLTKLVETFDVNKKYSRDSVIICGLFHDLGKIGSLEKDYYIPQDSDWHREKLGEHYKYDETITYLFHSERSLWWLHHYNVQLTEVEYQAIDYHDGQYVERNVHVKQKEELLTLLLHFADMLSIKDFK